MSAPRKRGRPPGAVNKLKKDLMEAAQVHGPAALETLVQLMKDKAQPGAVRKGAADSILDRAYGKPSQTVHNKGDVAVTQIVRRIVDPANDRDA